MNYSKISIITPSYNQGNYIEQTILSVINQNYPNLEYIIIDGGSTDNSVEIIKKYEKYITYWVSESDGGMYEAIQKGFEKSTGEIMAWINSDDMYHPNAFYTVADIFDHLSEVSWMQGIPSGFDERGRTVSVGHYQPLWSKYNFYTGTHNGWIQQESTFWRRSLWEKAGSYIDQDLKYAGDFALWLRFFKFEKLYIADALVGGFRGRTNNQFSLDYYSDYLQEVSLKLNTHPLSNVEKVTIKKIIYYKNLLKKFSRINIWTWKEKYFDLFEYPPKISFNRKNQKFELIKFKDLNNC